jgi:hypothetical protein
MLYENGVDVGNSDEEVVMRVGEKTLEVRVYLTDEDYERMCARARELGLSKSGYIRLLVRDFVRKGDDLVKVGDLRRD